MLSGRQFKRKHWRAKPRSHGSVLLSFAILISVAKGGRMFVRSTSARR